MALFVLKAGPRKKERPKVASVTDDAISFNFPMSPFWLGKGSLRHNLDDDGLIPLPGFQLKLSQQVDRSHSHRQLANAHHAMLNGLSLCLLNVLIQIDWCSPSRMVQLNRFHDGFHFD